MPSLIVSRNVCSSLIGWPMSRYVRADHLPSVTEPPGSCVQVLRGVARRLMLLGIGPPPTRSVCGAGVSCPAPQLITSGGGSVALDDASAPDTVRTQADFEPAADDAVDVRVGTCGRSSGVSPPWGQADTTGAAAGAGGRGFPLPRCLRGDPCPAATAQTSSPRIQENDNARERVTATPYEESHFC